MRLGWKRRHKYYVSFAGQFPNGVIQISSAYYTMNGRLDREDIIEALLGDIKAQKGYASVSLLYLVSLRR